MNLVIGVITVFKCTDHGKENCVPRKLSADHLPGHHPNRGRSRTLPTTKRPGLF